MSAPVAIPIELQRYLRRYVARARRVMAARAVGVGVAFALLWLLLWALVDRLVPMHSGVRVALLLANLGMVAMLLAHPLWRLITPRVEWTLAAAAIERRDRRWGERLQTVTSQWIAPPQLRASPLILQHLTSEVSAEAASHDPARLVQTRSAGHAWLAAGALAAVAAFAAMIPWLSLPTLLARQLLPLADIEPVTTTVLSIEPGDASVIQGDSLRITARALRLGNGGVLLRLSGDGGQAWTSQPMQPATDGRFAATLSDVQHDYHYQVIGGDAKSAIYAVRVLRRPAVTSFRIHYLYPAYTGLKQTEASNLDGQIEAVAGSSALVAVSSTEPLKSAVFTLASGERISAAATAEPTVREASIPVRQSGAYRLELTSDRGVHGPGPSGAEIRAIPDQPPSVRMLLPGPDLRLPPHATLSIPYQASDDFGVMRLVLLLGHNGNPPREQDVNIEPGASSAQGTVELDLSALDAVLGDVVTVSIAATDGAGQRVETDPLRIMIAPKAADADALTRVAELKEAARLAGTLVRRMDAAVLNADDVGRDPGQAGDLGGAADACAAITRALLRAIARTDSPQLATALATTADTVQPLAAGVARLTDGSDTAPPSARGRAEQLSRLFNAARALAEQLRSTWHGEQAALAVIDRENLRAISRVLPRTGRAQGQLLRQALETTGQAVLDSIDEIGVDPHARDVDALLEQKIEAEHQLLATLPAVDYVDAARSWAAAPTNDPVFVQRVALGSRSEAARRDADYAWARDLDLAARAARALTMPATTQPAAPSVAEYPDALAAMWREHELHRPLGGATKPQTAETDAIHAAAEGARQKMRNWASASKEQRSDEDDDAVRALEAAAWAARKDLAALQAAATAAAAREKQPDRTAGAAARSTSANQSLADAIRDATTAQQAERLAEQQRSLSQKTAASQPATTQRTALGDAQRKIADQIGKLTHSRDENGSRRRALDVIRAADEKLAAIPPGIDALLAVAQTRRQARQRLSEYQLHPPATQPLATTVPSTSPTTSTTTVPAITPAPSTTAPSAATQPSEPELRRQLTGAARRVASAARVVSPQAGQAVAEDLKPFAPETSPVVMTIEQSLQPALGMLAVASNSDAAGADAVAAQAGRAARTAAEQARAQLKQAEQSLVAGDRLSAAQTFAERAASALSQSGSSSSPSSASGDQSAAAAALDQAADALARRAAAGQLAGSSGFGFMFAPPSASSEGAALGGSGRDAMSGAAAGTSSAAREWGKLQPRGGADESAAPRETDPPGYQDALRIYFQALSRSSSTRGGRNPQSPAPEQQQPANREPIPAESRSR